MEENYTQEPVLRELPYNRQAEISVLGSMLQDISATESAVHQLRAGDFYLPAHQDIFEQIVSLFTQRAPVSAVSLVAELDRAGKLAAVGDAAYVAELTIQTPSASNCEYFIGLVLECSQRRKLIAAGGRIATDAYDNSRPLEDVLADAERLVYDISMRGNNDSLLPVGVTAMHVFTDLGDPAKRSAGLQGLPTGFLDLNKKLNGLKKSDLIVVAGRPGMGKTSFAINVAQHVALHAGHAVAVFSLEMSREQLVMRMFSTEAEIDMARVLQYSLNEDEMITIYEKAVARMENSRMYIDDTANVTVPEIRTKCRRLKADKGLDLIVIDYLQLMHSHRRVDNRQQEISEITRSLKVLARELDIPIVLLSQLSRAPESRKDNQDGHRPQLSDLRESGAIEQDADIVMLLYRDQIYNEDADNTCEINIAKNRNGPTGRVELVWLGEYTKFKDYHKDYDE